MFSNKNHPVAITFIFLSIFFFSCDTIDLYERIDSIPKHEWQADYKPKFTFNIEDTTVSYRAFIMLRHNEKYNFNNIWLNVYAQAPDGKTEKFTYELPLAYPDGKWRTEGMDDLYDHRILLFIDPEKFNFKKKGEYVFNIEHIMREDPLQNVLNVGLRLEKQ